MPFTYAVPDLHGRADLLELCLDAIDQHAPAPGTIVFLGDYVDHGPHSRAVIDRLMLGPDHRRWRWICLKGNHEDLMAKALRGRIRPSTWLRKGGTRTMASYGARADKPFEPGLVPPDHLRWIEGLPLLHVDRHRVFVHAGVDRRLPLSAQRPDTLMNHRYRAPIDGAGYGGLHIVHGHDKWRRGPRLFNGRTNLDVGAWQTGRIVIAVFNDRRHGGPSAFLEVRTKKKAGV